MKILVKVMAKESQGFACLRQNFPKIREAKIKELMFVGPHINSTERRAYEAFENICRKFLGSEKAENYGEIVLELISSYSAGGVKCH